MAASDIHMGSITTDGGHAIVGNDNQIIQNFYHSASYQAMESQRQKLLGHIQKYPDDSDFRQELARLLKQMEDFKRDVLKLAEDFQRIPLNTERLKLAKQHFDAGEYAQARAVLDAESITQEQDALLAEQQRLQEKQATITAQLDDKANEWLLKAHLTAIDYNLGDHRIAQTIGYFEKALKSGRTPDRLFTYACFLDENNQYRSAETHYTEALTLYRQFAKNNPVVYLRNVAATLNNFGILVEQDNQRREEAESCYTEALALYRQLAKDNPAVYLPDMAMTLNNFGVLLMADNQRHKDAEILYIEALTIRRSLAKDNPAVHLPDVAMTLNNFGILLMVDSLRRKEAKILYIEALAVYRKLAQDNPVVYISNVATILNNLGVYSQRRKEAEIFYTEALTLRRKLAQDNPAVYLPDVATTLWGFGRAYLKWNEPTQALPLLQESAQLFAPLAQQAPGVFEKKHDAALQLIEIAKVANG